MQPYFMSRWHVLLNVQQLQEEQAAVQRQDCRTGMFLHIIAT